MSSLLPLTDLIVFLAKLNSAAVKITQRCFVSRMLWWREMFSQNIWPGAITFKIPRHESVISANALCIL